MSDHLHDLFSRVHGVITEPGERDDRLQAICDLLRENVDHYDRVGFHLGEHIERARSPSGRQICMPIRKNGVVAAELVIETHAGSPLDDEERQFLEGICTFVSGML